MINLPEYKRDPPEPKEHALDCPCNEDNKHYDPDADCLCDDIRAAWQEWAQEQRAIRGDNE